MVGSYGDGRQYKTKELERESERVVEGRQELFILCGLEGSRDMGRLVEQEFWGTEADWGILCGPWRQDCPGELGGPRGPEQIILNRFISRLFCSSFGMLSFSILFLFMATLRSQKGDFLSDNLEKFLF